MTKKTGREIVADKDIDAQTKSLKILADILAENPRDNSQSNIMNIASTMY